VQLHRENSVVAQLNSQSVIQGQSTSGSEKKQICDYTLSYNNFGYISTVLKT